MKKCISELDLPDSIFEILSSKFRDLSESSRELLIKISLVGDPLSVRLIGLISGFPNVIVSEALNTLITEGLVKEKNIGNESHFVISGVVSDMVVLKTDINTNKRLSYQVAMMLEKN